jgi:IclR family pca regulon transcriptional regulator
VLASLSVTVPTSRFTSEAVREVLVPALKRTGAAIEAELARTGA